MSNVNNSLRQKILTLKEIRQRFSRFEGCKLQIFTSYYEQNKYKKQLSWAFRAKRMAMYLGTVENNGDAVGDVSEVQMRSLGIFRAYRIRNGDVVGFVSQYSRWVGLKEYGSEMAM